MTNKIKQHSILRPHGDNFCIDSETDFRAEADFGTNVQRYSFKTFSWSGIGKEELSIDCEIEVSIDPFPESQFEVC